MNLRRILLSLVLMVLAVILQTTVFHSVRPFGVSPAMVLLAVIATARWLEPEPGVLMGFTGGLVLDLFGTAPLGLHALAFTLAGYATVSLRDRFNYGIQYSVSMVGLITFVGLGIVALIGTLFGEGTLGSPEFLKTLIVAPAYNMALGTAILPLVSRLFAARPSSRFARPGGLL